MNIESYIDHTLLKAEVTLADIQQIIQEAIQYQFVSVCINPHFVKVAKKHLNGTGVKVCTVIGFPLGANKTNVKVFEAKEAIADGAEEIDYVVNVSDVKNGYYDQVEAEMKEFIQLKDDQPNLVIKVILENCYLTKKEIQKVCEIAKKIKIDFVKTSTGFGSSGATIEDLQLMRESVGPEIGVKASGGVRTYEDALAAIEAGATRIGASSSVNIVTQREGVKSEGY